MYSDTGVTATTHAADDRRSIRWREMIACITYAEYARLYDKLLRVVVFQPYDYGLVTTKNGNINDWALFIATGASPRRRMQLMIDALYDGEK